VGGDHWVFWGWDFRREEPLYLASAGKTRILRHIKVRSALNAYAPEWQDYLQRRRSHRAARAYPALRESVGRETAALQREAQPPDQRLTRGAPVLSWPRAPKTPGCVREA